MAAPLLRICGCSRYILEPLVALGVKKINSISFSYLSTSTPCSKKQRNVFSVKKFQKLMDKKKKKFYLDPVNPSQLGKMSTLEMVSKKNLNRVGSDDSVKLRIYNTILFEHIGDLVNSNYISAELERLEVPLLAVRMAGDLSVARVYWQASGNAEADDKVQAVLDRFTGQVRHALISLRVLGNVPRVCFLKDKAAANVAEIDRLLATADFGPDDEELEHAEGQLTPETKWKSPPGGGGHAPDGSPMFARGGASTHKAEGLAWRYEGPNFFAVDHADALEQIASKRKLDESKDAPEGFAPITDAVERFKVFQRKKKAKKNIRDDDRMYMGQLDVRDASERDQYMLEDQDESFEYEDYLSDGEIETNSLSDSDGDTKTPQE